MSHSIKTGNRLSSIRNLKPFAALTLGLAAFLLAGLASAQGIDPAKIKEIPTFTTLPQEQFEAQSDLHTATPSGDKYLAYSIRLPKGWQKASGDKLIDTTSGSQDHLTHHVLGRIAKYYAPQTMDISSYIDIEALALDYNISARNWFLNYILANGYTLLGMKEVQENHLVALYDRVVRSQSYVVRTAAQINGSRIVLMSYSMPEQNWDDEKATQEKVVDSFQFLNPEKASAEAARTYVYLDLLRFDYPQSWQLMAPSVNATEGMSVRLIDSKDRETLDGQVEIRVESTDSDKTLAQQVQDLRNNLKTEGLEIGGLIEAPTDYKFHNQIYFNKVEVYDAHGRDDEFGTQELWLAIMIEDRYYYIVSMITPGRNHDFLKWAKNIESFRTIIESFRL
jgi:TfoX/Sxy family transcriptional regulator of competence genes